MKHALAKVTTVKALPGHRLALVFADGATGTYDCSPLLWGEMFEPLKSQKYFAKVMLDHGAPSWPNGADLDPGVIREAITPARSPKKKSSSMISRRPKSFTVAEEQAGYDAKPARKRNA